MHQFSLGEVVTCGVRYAAPGDYKILSFMPDRDGERTYRIKSPLEEHQRVVKESLLSRSAGYLCDEVPQQRPPRRSITLVWIASSSFRRDMASVFMSSAEKENGLSPAKRIRYQ